MPPLKRVPSSSTLGRAPTASTSVRGAKPPLSSSSNLGRPSTVLGIRSTSGAASSSKGAGSGPSSSHGGATGSADTRERREGEGIKVFVRVRGHASSEPPVTNSILSTAGPRGHQIHVALDQPVVSSASSAAAAAALASDPGQERTYTFDGVFGPDADQGLVYQDVVVPILNDVLNGYKCTIFAYGQTGTGKTHTMEGNLESKGTFHFDAGIIPRTLDRLFHQVEMDKERELSVRATFLELYNEDLRDLLSPDFSAPGASTGIGKGGSSNLKIFESKDGPQVQGVWETPISSAEEGLKLLRQGSERRQVAATNCNDVSSRSHSIFTLTVYTRDTSPNAKDNDLLKVGKLYLVDLAGSESIERSGAKEKGAREAGMINKSLLTLGRVINALVEGSAHVPYRESNLTRLLQDSLGGGHKTSIIATVSQAKSNVEETLSTLDYALRAKSIKNRPELNAKLNRPALVKDLENMVKVLQADLRACIQQSGRYISEENYSRMLSDHDATQRQRDEFKREVEVEKSKVSSIAEQVEHMAQRDVKRQAENTELRSALEKSQAEARSLRKELSAAHSRVEALSESERILFMTAQELQADGARSVADNEGLIAKIARQTSSEKDIFSGIMAYQLSLKSHLSEIENSALVITTSTDSFCQRSSESVSSYAAQRTEEENARKATLQGHAEAINSIMQTLHQQRGSTDGALAQLCDALSSLLGSIAKEGEETLAKYEQSTSQLFSQLSDHLRANRKEVEKAARVSTANADEIVTLVGQHLAQLKGELDDLKARIDNSAKEWKDTLEQQQATEAEEIADWDSGLEQVVEHLVAISRRTKAHREARVTRLIEHAARSAEHRASRLSEVDVIQAECEALWNELDGRQGVLRKGYEEIHSTLKTHERSLKGEMHGLEQTVSNALQDQVSHLARGAVGLQEQLACGRADVSSALDQGHGSAMSIAQMAREIVGSGVAHAEGSLDAASKLAETCRGELMLHSASMLAKAQEVELCTTQIRSDVMSQLEQGLRPYAPLGSTPSKRQYNFNRTLQLASQSGIRSARSSVQLNANASFSSQATMTGPRGSEIGRMASTLRNFLPGVVTGGAGHTSHNSSAPGDTTATSIASHVLAVPGSGSGGGGALQDLSKSLNVPRGTHATGTSGGKAAAASKKSAGFVGAGATDAPALDKDEEDDYVFGEDDDMNAIDTSLGAIKRSHMDMKASATAFTAAAVDVAAGSGPRSKRLKA